MAGSGPAEWLRRRRLLRIALIGLLFPLPLLAVVSAALVAMTTILHGWRLALQDCLGALLLLLLLTAFAGGYWVEIGVGAWLTWMVAVLLAHLRREASLTLALQVAVLLGLAGTLAFLLWSPDPLAFWEQVLVELVERARIAGLQVEPSDFGMGVVMVMTGMMAASAVASSMAALFLGSWWAGQHKGRTFGQEFQLLSMGRVISLSAAVLGLLFVFGVRSFVDDLLLVLATGFIVQGLAVIHWHGARRGWPAVWPLALYLPLVLLPAVAALEMLLLVLIGLVDNGYSLRRGWAKVV